MQHCDTLIVPEWCVPIEPADTVLTQHAIAVADGRIVGVLPASDARDRYQPSVLLERPGHILIPGLINAHTHAAMVLFRGMADDLPLESWLHERVWPAERRWVSAEMVRDGTELAIAEMLRAGITCFADQYFFPEIAAEAAIDLHMRAMIGTPVVEFDTPWAAGAAECLTKGAELVHDPYADHPLISTCFAPHSTAVLADDSLRQTRILADQLDCSIQMHLHETELEVSQSVGKHGKRPLARLQDLGLVNASLLIVHGVAMTTSEIALLAEVGVGIVHCPRSNLKLASGIAPVADFLDAGVAVALGTDGAASNNVLDVLGEMRAAAMLAKARSGDATAVSARTTLEMATLNAAKALGLADTTGSIRPGKSADLTCIDLSRPNSQPVYDPVSQVVYTAGADQVSDVWVAGRHLLDNGHLTNVDVSGLLARANEWRQRIVQDTR